MTVIHSTKDYDLVVLPEDYKDQYPDANYGVVNKQYNTVEATIGVLYAGFAVMEELQEKLNEHKPKEPTLRSIN